MEVRAQPRGCSPPLYLFPWPGKELRLAEYANRLSGVPSPAPADAGQGAPWEAAVDAFWASRLSAGDPVVASIGADRVEKAVAALLDASVKKIEEKK